MLAGGKHSSNPAEEVTSDRKNKRHMVEAPDQLIQFLVEAGLSFLDLRQVGAPGGELVVGQTYREPASVDFPSQYDLYLGWASFCDQLGW